MNEEIDVQTLQDWLAQGRPVKVLDVRTAGDREEWWIPGSQHVDAYESLKSGSPGALADISIPEGQPVVTVCGVGRTSAQAAEMLATQRGISALSLTGGMKAWSLAWNAATCTAGPVEITQIRRTGKGCLSYFIRSEAEAAVIDASVDPAVYMSLATRSRARIRYVLDTHLHADHVSRARLLAERSGAELILPRQNRVHFSHKAVNEGDSLPLGETSIEVLETPGHTAESVAYLLPSAGIFTGDTLFLAGVGRPDLHSDKTDAGARARLLFRSLTRLASLEPQLLLFPGHTPEPAPFDGRPLTASLGKVMNRLRSWLVSEDEFVGRILPRIPPTPPNYLVISQINERGEWPEGDLTDLEAGANRCAVS